MRNITNAIYAHISNTADLLKVSNDNFNEDTFLEARTILPSSFIMKFNEGALNISRRRLLEVVQNITDVEFLYALQSPIETCLGIDETQNTSVHINSVVLLDNYEYHVDLIVDVAMNLETDAAIQYDLSVAENISTLISAIENTNSSEFECLDSQIINALETGGFINSNTSDTIIGSFTAEPAQHEFDLTLDVEDAQTTLGSSTDEMEEAIKGLGEEATASTDANVEADVGDLTVVEYYPPPPSPAAPPSPIPPSPLDEDDEEEADEISDSMAIVFSIISSVLVLVIILMGVFVYRRVLPRWRINAHLDDCRDDTQPPAPAHTLIPIATRGPPVPLSRMHGSYADYIRDRNLRV